MYSKSNPPAHVRLWVWINESPVKLTLHQHNPIAVAYGGRTDEGYSYTAESWFLCDDQIVHMCRTEELDCDGRLDRCGEWYCHYSEAMAEEPNDYVAKEHPDTRWPAWTERSRHQRDYSAEAMGY